MRFRYALLVCVFPAVAAAQTAAEKAATVKYVLSLRDPATGAYRVAPDGKPSLRAVNGAVKALHYLHAELPQPEKTAKFVLSCYDPKTGAFAEPGGKPDVTITSIGVMAAAELGIPKEEYAKAMDYLKANAKTFEEVRIGAAAVEAWGAKDCPFDLKPWFTIADKDGTESVENFNPRDYARGIGSHAAFSLRLGRPIPGPAAVAQALRDGQRDDGGWGKKAEKSSDIETTYRVMRALMLLKEKPKGVKKLRAFVASHRNADGGYAARPGDKSTMSGVYYASIITKWLDEMEK